MFFINTETLDYPVMEGFIRALYPDASFPSPFVPPAPYEVVQDAVQPSFNRITQRVKEKPPINVNGKWTRQWEVVALSVEEAAVVANEAGRLIRLQRNQMLMESDWTQLLDVSPTIAAAWAPYRQALRDIPEQPGFPFNVNWPTQPV